VARHDQLKASAGETAVSGEAQFDLLQVRLARANLPRRIDAYRGLLSG
jgi:hypothetical protein